jgi:hypothetical protein
VPAGSGGNISIFASNPTHLVIDINGYFANAGAGGLSLYMSPPCRLLDTRGHPALSGATDVLVDEASCGVPLTAQAVVLGATVVPPGPLGFLTLWPQGRPEPLVATLNALDAEVTSNLAIVSTADASISALPSNPAQLVLDIFGYFALPDTGAPTIMDFNPKSAVAGALVTVTGANLAPSPQVTLSKQGGGTIAVGAANPTATSLQFAIPIQAATGPVTVMVGAQSTSSAIPLTIVPLNPPRIASFTASPSSITSGASSILSWSVSGSPQPSLSLSNIGAVSGPSITIAPFVSTTYILTATNSAGSTSKGVTVSVVPSSNVITFDPTVRHQTMTGWEGTAYGGQDVANFASFQDPMLDGVVDLGINRVRLEIPSGAENPIDYWTLYRSGQISAAMWSCVRYSVVNDNASPTSINAAGFQFAKLDDTVDKIVAPLRNKLAAKGEKLWISVDYVAFTASITAPGCPSNLQYFHNTNPQEYAEFVLATYKHLQQKYGIVPDSWEMMLEPDNTVWTPAQLGQALAASASLLIANGFTPYFVAPSTTCAYCSVTWFNTMITVPGVLPYLRELSYHRYVNAGAANTAIIGSTAAQYGTRTAMLEWIGAEFDTLLLDLQAGNNSAWAQYALATPYTENGGSYYHIESGAPVLTSRAMFLRHFFKYVRMAAVRVAASSNNPLFEPVAFQNTPGAQYKDVVVVKAAAAGAFRVRGLPAGVYGISYTTGDFTTSPFTVQQYNVTPADQVINSGEDVAVAIPGSGVITVYGK